MFEWLRKNLYIHTILAGNIDAINRVRELNSEIKQLKIHIDIHNQAIGYLIAKLSPTYNMPEDDLQKESDRIGDETIRRLRAEYLARQHTEGKL